MRLRLLLTLVLFACTKPTSASTTTPPPSRASDAPKAWTFVDEPAKPQPLKVATSEAPMQLTASDGSGLGIVSVTADAVIDAPLALTQLRLVFDNPRAQQIEGQFRITLPERASISRFAMLTNGQWQEGEVVERQAARRAYEDFLHRRQDPALLEQQAGNEFSARIFPIPPHAHKEVIIAYSEELLGDTYRIALKGLPQVGAIDIRVNHDGTMSELHQQSVMPDKDFDMKVAAGGDVALRKDNLVVARVTPVTDVDADTVESLVVLVDTSASRTLGKDADLALVKDLVARLNDAPVAVWAFDQTTLLVDEGKASAINWTKLEQRRSLGASNLQQALAAVAAHKTKYARGLLISDGVVTAGLDTLADAVKATGVRRFDAVAVGGIRDRDALQRLVLGDGLVVDGALPPATIAKKLNHKTRSGMKVAVPGADWVWPETLDGMQPGEPALVYADLAEGKPFAITIDGKPIGAGTLKRSERPLLERAWVAARIKRLLDQKERTSDKDMKEALTKQVVELSTTHRVLCPLTALLVLETEADYARFHIDRKALSSILVVENGRIVVSGRQAVVIAKAPVQKDKLKEDRDGARDLRPTPPSAAGAPPPSDDLGRQASAGGASHARGADTDDFKEAGGEAEKAVSSNAPAAAPAPSVAQQMQAPTRDAMPREMRNQDPERASPRPAVVSRPPPPPAPPTAQPDVKPQIIDPYTGQFRIVMKDIRHKQAGEALTQADSWWRSTPGDVMALVALGEALEANGDIDEAARAYGSLIDLFPARADMRRFAGQRLERLKSPEALLLAIDTYAKAEEQRPDHPQSHRLLAYALLKRGEPEKAFDVLEKGARQRYPDGRFAGVDQIFAEDLGIAAQAWIKTAPARKDEIYKRLANDGGRRETAPSLRFILSWETDANDVDFHIFDSKDGHAFYSARELPSGGELYADVTTGYGPECFTIRGKPTAAPYKLQAHYYSRGPMGYGMGKLEIVQHDGQGNLKFDERPFVVMQDQAFLDLGTVGRTL